jgi:hypothetical protein
VKRIETWLTSILVGSYEGFANGMGTVVHPSSHQFSSGILWTRQMRDLDHAMAVMTLGY